MKFCTCDEKKPKRSYDHAAGCDFYKIKPETKDEKIARLESRLHEQSVSETLLYVLMKRSDVAPPVEVSVETYDDPPQTVTVKVWTHRGDDGIVWADDRAQWLGKWTDAMRASEYYYLRDLASKVNVIYEKRWSGK